MPAVVRPDVRVGADVFAQHAGLLAADATFLTDVFTSSTPTYINILLIRFVSAGLQQDTCLRGQPVKAERKKVWIVPAVKYFDPSWFGFRCDVLVQLLAGLRLLNLTFRFNTCRLPRYWHLKSTVDK